MFKTHQTTTTDTTPTLSLSSPLPVQTNSNMNSPTEKRKNGNEEECDNKKSNSVADVKEIVMDTIHDKLEEMGVAKGKVLETIDSAVEDTKELCDAKDNVKEKLGDIIGDTKEKLVDAKDVVVDKLIDAKNVVVDSAKEKASDTKDAVVESIDSAKEKAVNIKDIIIEEKPKTTTEKIQETMSDVGHAFKDAKDVIVDKMTPEARMENIPLGTAKERTEAKARIEVVAQDASDAAA